MSIRNKSIQGLRTSIYQYWEQHDTVYSKSSRRGTEELRNGECEGKAHWAQGDNDCSEEHDNSLTFANNISETLLSHSYELSLWWENYMIYQLRTREISYSHKIYCEMCYLCLNRGYERSLGCLWHQKWDSIKQCTQSSALVRSKLENMKQGQNTKSRFWIWQTLKLIDFVYNTHYIQEWRAIQYSIQ